LIWPHPWFLRVVSVTVCNRDGGAGTGTGGVGSVRVSSCWGSPSGSLRVPVPVLGVAGGQVSVVVVPFVKVAARALRSR
jgi:hypothetical protein